MTAQLNGDLLRQLRIDAHIGLYYAAETLGVGVRTLTRVETGDTAATKAISVQGLLNLADALGCEPADLFNTGHISTSDTENEQIDPGLLVGVLHEHRNQVSTKDLATIFNTTNATIRTAAQTAATHLAGTGLRLGQRNDHYFLTADHHEQTKKLAIALTQTNIARHGIDKGQARILKQILDGRLANGRQSLYTRTAIGLLQRLGIITTSDRTIVPSEALKYALDV